MELQIMRKNLTGKEAEYDRWDHSRWTPTVIPKPLMGHRINAHINVSLLHSITFDTPTNPSTWTRVM